MISTVFSVLATAAVIYLALAALLYFTQESAIFLPGPNDAGLRQRYEKSRVEIPTGHGETVEGWWIENPAATNDLAILYFGGNAEDVLYTAETASRFDARHVFVSNYRGYGGSTGRPGQEALYEDGLAVYEHALKRGVRPDELIVLGRSLGSGVAAMIAGSRPVRAAIFVTPFDSLASVAAHHYPYFPVRLLLRHPFPSIEWARKASAPALVLGAANDDIVPVSHARALAESWAGPTRVHVLPDTGHNDIEQSPEYYRLINAFLSEHLVHRNELDR
jgi:pimeloyl-ACP methyl ester carboxylesterase